MTHPVVTKEDAALERDEAIKLAHLRYEKRLREIDELSAKTAATPAEDRAKRAWELRQQGLTLKKVGEALGVKAERASQLIRQYERRLAYEPGSNPLDGLSVRASNCLHQYQLKSAEEIASVGSKRLAKVPNMGPKSLAEIALWLKNKGFKLAP